MVFVFMPITYFVVVQNFPTGEWSDLTQLPPVGFALAGCSLISAIMGFFVPQIFMNSPEVQKALQHGNKAAKEKALMAPTLIRFVLFETISIFGLVLCFMLQKNILLPFFGLNLVLMLLYFPKAESDSV